MILSMALNQYRDDFVPHEVGEAFGKYLMSYTTSPRRVEVHLFLTRERTVTVYVKKLPAVSVAEAHQAVREALAQDEVRQAAGDLTHPRVVYDSHSIGRSGSL